MNATTIKKQRTLVTGCTENEQQQDMSTQEFILIIKFDEDQNNNSKDMKRSRTELIQIQGGKIIFLQLPRVLLLLLHLGGDHPAAG